MKRFIFRILPVLAVLGLVGVFSNSAGLAGDPPISDSDRNFWAFQPPKIPAIPALRSSVRVRNPIDALILHALEQKGLSLSPEADRLTLLRRAFFDLIGLAPAPNEIEAFLADQSPDAYERLIDRLLNSSHYGERWGRHWLDLAGYADSEGILDADYVRTAAWRYRDFVIQAFNKDIPYDQFLRLQIAGDELVDYWKAYQTQRKLSADVVEGLVATGFLRCASDTSRPDFVNIKNAPGYYYQTLDDTVKIVASSTLGLTLECAKCHNHKYDPISQHEYYQIQAIFMSAYRPNQWVPQEQRRLLDASEAQENEATAKKDSALAQLQKKLEDLKHEFSGFYFTGRLGKLPEAIREDVRVALITDPAKRTEVQKYLAGKFEKDLKPDPKTLERVLATEFVTYKIRLKEIEDAVKSEKAKSLGFPEIRAIYDLPGEPKTPMLRRGDYLKPGPDVQPGALSALAVPRPFTWTPPAKNAKSSGRRLAFVQWLTQPGHPLTPRVLVNRLWFHHFGEGIVSTPDNFGKMGALPSHPELLDWLALELERRNWSLKSIHRLIMTSATYRQQSSFDAVAHASAKRADPDNRLLWRQRLRRLDAEVIRDSVLQASGLLNSRMFGPPIAMQRQPDGEVTLPGEASGRRSVYLQIRRSQPLTLLQVFDQPVMETNCTRRGQSTVASQALTLLNSQFLIKQAEEFADRITKENPAHTADQAVRLAFSRLPTENERARIMAFLEEQTARHLQAVTAGPENGTSQRQELAHKKALADLCHMLLSSNEFLYVD